MTGYDLNVGRHLANTSQRLITGHPYCPEFTLNVKFKSRMEPWIRINYRQKFEAAEARER